MDLVDLIIKLFLPIFILVFGLIGNSIGFITFFRKNLKKFPAKNVYIILAIEDLFYLIFAITYRLCKNNGVYMKFVSPSACKLIKYIEYSIGAIQPCLLVLISIIKFITIRYPNKNLIKKRSFQLFLVLIIYICCISFYLPIIIYSDLELTIQPNNFNLTNYECKISDTHKDLLSYMDLFYSTLLPFFLMSLFSVLLILTAIKSRLRQHQVSNLYARKKFRRNLKLAFTAVTINVTFICLNFPVCIAEFQENNNLLKEISNLLFYFSFSIDFYILAYFNSIIRKETRNFLIELINKFA